jgi:ribonuclease HII
MWSHDFFERILHGNGYRRIAGVDEVGRGALAGPVVAAAVMFDGTGDYQEIRDSKTLSAKRREKLAERIKLEAIGSGLASVPEKVIDRINILQATHRAMHKAIENLPIPPDIVLVDGFWLPGLEPPCIGIIGGDARSYSIAAASIVAKVARDAYMTALAPEYPQYGFDQNKGYGTGLHMRALVEHGPSSCHRQSFGRVRTAEAGGGNDGH